jgi:putative thiamine transport system permease protein
VIRGLPRLVLALLILPVVAGLAATFAPGLRQGGLAALADWPGLPRAAALSAGTGLAATLLSLAVTFLVVAMLHDRPAFGALRRMLSPLLAVPHAAAALGLAFVIAPSGWIARALSPWATGWQRPPDLMTLNDPLGLALTLGLVAKEVPFLLLMALAALPACDPARRLLAGAALGHGRLSAFALAVWPPLYARLRLPVLAVLAYGMTTVEMAMVLGPGLPPTLSAQIALWMTEPALTRLPTASAAALVQLALVVAAMALWRLGEATGRMLLRAHLARGTRARRADPPARALALALGFGLAALLILALAGLALWSVTADWTFPAALPQTLSLRSWSRALPGLSASFGLTLALAAAVTAVALVLVIGCLEAELRLGLRPGLWIERALYLPLLVPQIAMLPGLQMLALTTGAEGTAAAVAAAHLVFVLPYVFLSLAPAWRGWDARQALTAASLGAGAGRIFWRLRLPQMLGPVLTAAALGLAVSAGQYLPTLLIGGGRVGTLTTEAVALSSGGNRRLVGLWGLAQMLLPALAFALALTLPRLVFRNRRAMLAGARR